MKQCPKCRNTYSDDSLKFCLADGTPLARFDNEKTLELSGAVKNQKKARGLNSFAFGFILGFVLLAVVIFSGLVIYKFADKDQNLTANANRETPSRPKEKPAAGQENVNTGDSSGGDDTDDPNDNSGKNVDLPPELPSNKPTGQEDDKPSNGQGDDDLGSAPTFDQYRVPVSDIAPEPVKFDGNKDAKMFRTRLNEARKGGVNFAGHYIFASWGCGSGCVIGAIIDADTGTVYFPEELGGMGFGMGDMEIPDEPLQFKKDSKLFVLYGYPAKEETEGIYYFVWENTRFKKVKFVRPAK